MEERMKNIIKECSRQEESCLYTSTALYEWIKSMRSIQRSFIFFSIILGGFSACPFLFQHTELIWLSGFFGVLAGLLPSIYKALEFDHNLMSLIRSATEFKILQDRFRQAQLVTSFDSFENLNLEFHRLMERMDNERRNSLSVPKRFFNKAKKKIANGDYKFKTDEAFQKDNTEH